MNKRSHSRNIRAIKGYALITTLLIGSFSIMFLLALGGTLVSTSRSNGTFKSKRLLEEAAVIGLDYTIQNMNDAIENNTVSAFDIPAGAFETPVQNLPASYYSNLITDTTVKIRVRKLTDTELGAIKDFSTIYQSLYGPEPTANQPSPQNVLRMAEVTASNGTFTKSIRAILEPHSPGAEGPEGSNPQQRKGLFPSAGIFANTNLSLDGNVTAQIHPSSNPIVGSWPARGYDTPDDPSTTAIDPTMNYRLDVQTNQYAGISNGAKIVGNLKVSNSPTNALPVAANAQDGTQIYGRAFLSNSTDPSQQAVALQGTAGDTPGALDEVLAQAERDASLGGSFGANRVGYNKTTPINMVTSQADLKQFIVPPVPSDASAIDPYGGVGMTSGLTRWEYVYPEGTSGLPEQSAFKVNALDLTSSNPSATKLSFIPLANAPPAKVYIDPGTVLDGNGAALPALNIDSNMFTISEYSSNPLALQIFYSGTQDIKINITDGNNGIGRFDGLIFAPNAKVTITGKGNFYGNVVADNLQVTAPVGNLTLNLVTELDNYNSSTAFSNSTNLNLKPPSYQPQSVYEGYSPVTYQKFNEKLVE